MERFFLVLTRFVCCNLKESSRQYSMSVTLLDVVKEMGAYAYGIEQFTNTWKSLYMS